MTRSLKSRPRAPKVGSVLFEVGRKEEAPTSRVVISWVYCGEIEYNGEPMHLLVEFSRWFHLKRLDTPITADHGLKVRTQEQLFNGRLKWTELRTWIKSQE